MTRRLLAVVLLALATLVAILTACVSVPGAWLAVALRAAAQKAHGGVWLARRATIGAPDRSAVAETPAPLTEAPRRPCGADACTGQCATIPEACLMAALQAHEVALQQGRVRWQ